MIIQTVARLMGRVRNSLFSDRSDLILSALAFSFIVVALVMQYGFDLEPCPLCMVQRLVFFVLGLLFLLVYFVRKSRIWLLSGYLSAALMSLAGLTFALRHVWLQHLPKDQLPGCIPSLGYILDAFPLVDAVGRIFKGSADCGEVSWTFLGLSIPEQTSLVFGAFLIVSIMKTTRSARLKAFVESRPSY